MYLCYLDESGDTGQKGSNHLLLGAACIFEGHWTYVRNDIEALITKYFPNGNPPKELHCNEIRHGRRDFSILTPAQRTQLLAEFCGLLSKRLETEMRLFTVVVEKKRWFEKNPDKGAEEMYLDAFEEIVGRIDMYLRRRHAIGSPSKAVLIVDPHSTSLTKALKSKLIQFQKAGTRWANIYNIVEAVMFLESHESPGLQIADLCAYAVWRLVEFDDASLAEMIFDSFDREPLGGSVNPGKWHGVKYVGSNKTALTAISKVWA